MLTVNQIGQSVKTAQNTMVSAGRNAWLMSLGLVITIEEKTKQTFEQLVNKGKTFPVSKTVWENLDKVKSDVMTRVTSRGRHVEKLVRDRFQNGLTRFGIPTNTEISSLIDRVGQLNQKVNDIK